ncbi:hypothetical protein HK101_011188 [Irineochytrium annulatum]|nr:hypothetical protein HK101_011188 [Irineochytrium annulatum]
MPAAFSFVDEAGEPLVFSISRNTHIATVREAIESNGGRVVDTTKKQGVYMHLVEKTASLTMEGCYDQDYVFACIEMKQLLDKEPYAVAPTAKKSTRNPFTLADKKAILDATLNATSGQLNGNEIYKDLAKKNKRHTWQSWRDHAVKTMMKEIVAARKKRNENFDAPEPEEIINEFSSQPKRTPSKPGAAPPAASGSSSNVVSSSTKKRALPNGDAEDDDFGTEADKGSDRAQRAEARSKAALVERARHDEKIAAVVMDDDNPPAKKPPRGRPPKKIAVEDMEEEQSVDNVPTPDIDLQSAPARMQTRTRKTVDMEVRELRSKVVPAAGGPPAAVEPSPKRKRGRPRKADTASKVSESQIDGEMEEPKPVKAIKRVNLSKVSPTRHALERTLHTRLPQAINTPRPLNKRALRPVKARFDMIDASPPPHTESDDNEDDSDHRQDEEEDDKEVGEVVNDSAAEDESHDEEGDERARRRRGAADAADRRQTGSQELETVQEEIAELVVNLGGDALEPPADSMALQEEEEAEEEVVTARTSPAGKSPPGRRSTGKLIAIVEDAEESQLGDEAEEEEEEDGVPSTQPGRAGGASGSQPSMREEFVPASQYGSQFNSHMDTENDFRDNPEDAKLFNDMLRRLMKKFGNTRAEVLRSLEYCSLREDVASDLLKAKFNMEAVSRKYRKWVWTETDDEKLERGLEHELEELRERKGEASMKLRTLFTSHVEVLLSRLDQ